MEYTKEEIKKFLEDSIEWLKDQDQGCSTLKLDDRLAICVGWLDGYDENDEDVIHSTEDPDWAINAGIKVYTSDDMLTDYEFINSPYYDNGDVVQTDVSVQPNANLEELAEYFIEQYESMKDLNMEEDGRIIEDNFDDSYEDSEEDEEHIIDDREEVLTDKEKPNYVESCDLKEESNKVAKVKEAIEIIKKIDNEAFYPALLIYDILGDVEVTEDLVRKVESIESDFDSVYDDYMRDEIRSVYDGDIEESCKKESCDKKEVKESWEGESIIDDLIERAQSMYDEGGYGDIDDCVAQAIDDGLIYTDDIRALADHYGVLPDDSDLIAEFYEYLRDDVYAGVEEHESKEEEEDDWDFEDEEETNESLDESKGNRNYADVKVGDEITYSKRRYNTKNEPKKEYFKGIVKEVNGDTLKLESGEVVYKEPKDEFDFRFEQIREIKDPIKDVNIFKQGVDDLDDYQLLQKFRDAKNKYLTLKARHGGDANPTKDMKRRVDKFKRKLLARGITKESLESIDTMNEKQILEMLNKINEEWSKEDRVLSYLNYAIGYIEGKTNRDAVINVGLKSDYVKDIYKIDDDTENHVINNLDDYLLKLKKHWEESSASDWDKQKMYKKIDKILRSKSKTIKMDEPTNDKYLDYEKMTIEDIRTAPIGWYWEGDGEMVVKIDEDKIFLVANYIGDTVEGYVRGMIEEFGPNTKLKDICGDDSDYENGLGIMSEDELEEYRDEWEDAYEGDY